MNLGLKNRKALVTGAGRGLGEAIALQIAAEGAKVAIIARTKPDLEHVLTQMGGRKKGHYALTADLTEENNPKKVFNRVKKYFGGIDIVVNNLGDSLNIRDPFCPLSDWRKLWRVNMEVAIELNNLIIPSMQQKRWGRIVNISSISALENQGAVPYCSIKAALTAYSRSMGRVLAPFGIIITSVLPGAVFTKGGYWDQTSEANPHHVKKFINDRMATKRFGKPEEIASVVTFLCSTLSSFCVGSTVVVDGGQGRCFLNE